MTKLTNQAVKAPTAEDLVRVLKSDFYEETIELARSAGWSTDETQEDEQFIEAVFWLAKRITLPEQDQAAEVGS